MIQSKKDLKEYLQADKIALGRGRKKRPGFSDLIWRYEICLRKCEYYTNMGGTINRVLLLFQKVRFKILGILCGFEIPLNAIDKGLSIAHRGTIIINGGAKIGENCRIHAGVNIGTVPGCSSVAPKIGNDCYIGPGAKLYGDIRIASGIIIGANAVVTRSFEEENVCIAGVPARKISDIGRFELEKRNKEKYNRIQ